METEKSLLREQLPTLNNSAAAIAAGMRIGELEAMRIYDIEGVPHALLPEGMELRSMEHLSQLPPRIKFARKFSEPESFCQFAKEMKIAESGRLYGDIRNKRIEAIFADVKADTPSWEERKAMLDLVSSPELDAWLEKEDEALSQLAFVEFLEQMIHTIADPDGQQIAAAYRVFQAHRSVKVTQVIPESGNIKVAMEEEIRGTVSASQVEVPTRLTLCLRPFNLWKPYAVEVMVTYRLSNGALVFSYKMLRLSEIMDAAFDDVKEAVEKSLEMKVLF